ncbi:MAG: ABC transporter substrate-binding protein [SAR324 cluster bacterium]|nr:ABC transporter substrate-binding protein [SAR324 cluster bacterium]
MNNLFKSLILSIFIILPGVLSVQAGSHKKGGTLIMSVGATPRHLNPAVQSGIDTGAPGAQLFATPLRFDENWNPQPYLAESWSISDDGLSVTLNLVKGATFHDGKPITSKDVAFSIKTIKAHHPFKTMFGAVKRVDTPDSHTAVIRLSKPHPALLLALSSQLGAVIPEHIYGDGQDPKTHPRNSENVVGSGPFKLVEFVRDQHIILERNENFFLEGKPYLDKIVMRIIKDPSARSLGRENGEIHLSAFESTPQDILHSKGIAHLTATDKGYAAIGPITWLAFNTKSKPTSDVRVRQAIAYAVDRNFLINAVMRGTSKPAYTGIHPDSIFHEPNVERYDLDINKANQILDDAGYSKNSDGIRFPLNIDYGWPSAKPMAEYMKPQLKKIGIDVTVRTSAGFPAWAKTVSNWEFDMTVDVVFNWGDPVIGVHRTYLCENAKKGVIWSNTQQYCNPEVDQILEKAGQENDRNQRIAFYSKAQKLISKDVPIYFTDTVPYHTIYNHKKVGNPPSTIWGTCSPLDEVFLK